jgi:hypothetical protein
MLSTLFAESLVGVSAELAGQVKIALYVPRTRAVPTETAISHGSATVRYSYTKQTHLNAQHEHNKFNL